MATKSYMCVRWPSLRIGGSIKFADGWFKTDNKFLQDKIEGSRSFNVEIKLIPIQWDELEIPETPPANDVDFEVEDAGDDVSEQAAEPVIADPDDVAAITAIVKDSQWTTPDWPQDEEKEEDEEKPAFNYTATQLNHMRVRELKALAKELSIDQDQTTPAIKREIRFKLGV